MPRLRLASNIAPPKNAPAILCENCKIKLAQSALVLLKTKKNLLLAMARGGPVLRAALLDAAAQVTLYKTAIGCDNCQK